MAHKLNDVAAVVAVRDYSVGRRWYSRLIGRDPDLEPVERVGEWQVTATAWLQLVEDPESAGRSAVRFGVDDVDAQIAALNGDGISTGEPLIVGEMVKIVDVRDPDGNEVSFVEDLTTSVVE
ncbi:MULTISPECIES: VOC family protein [unclassified Mycobacterium]|uniref:VOC family protein n=1 Tax=unclassified Mycobacterium TaxID=2642494 RepID=UPI000740174D|nr:MULTISPECIES: VOC family protein [unclassified Mycobacterium]KUH81131.1 glyoxalase [Mycobacterium sp. GA-1999]KUH88100.1 glyoxalase [Mycobacterium sp. IS-1556]KUH90006.1 glyoxalase [Mycobacterium sp. GA-0227b]